MNSPLKIRIASPCSQSWDDMKGDERVRFCAACKLNVFNFAELSRSEIDALLLKAQGRTCAMIFQRADGTILTRDCPVGVAAIRRKVVRSIAAMVALVLALLGARSFTKTKACSTVTGGAKTQVEVVEAKLRATPMVGWVIEKIDPAPLMMKGDVALP